MSSNASLNHIYRTVWNQALGAMVAVAEISTASGKSSGPAARCRHSVLSPSSASGHLGLLAFSVALACAGVGVSAWANPTGAVALVGQASLDTQGSRLLINTQNGAGTNHSAINWQTFSIPAGQSTYFQQPSVGSTSINRVVSSTPSLIFGTLGSNGKLVLVNQSGITVGAGAVVDTAAFTASALAMSDANALAGMMRFGDGSGSGAGVLVQGRILGRTGDVVLLGLDVNTSKEALIQAPNGSTILAAGQKIALTGPGLEGIVLEVQAPGNAAVNLGALLGDAVGVFAGTLKHSGDIQANAVSVEGGRVVLKAMGQASLDGRTAAQRADGSGGSVEVLAKDIVIDAGASIVVDAAQQGDGGRVVVVADNRTQFDGSISAQGGALGGHGGFVETSGAQLTLGDAARVRTLAAAGQAGNWLLDPTDFTIATSGGDMTGATLQANLGGGNVTVQSSGGSSGTAGDVIVNDAVNWSANKLTLSAFNNIRINSHMTATGSASLALEFGQGAPVASNTSQVITGTNGVVDLPAGTSNFSTLQGSGGVAKAYTVITSLGSRLGTLATDLQGITNAPTLNYALGANILAAVTGVDITNWPTGFVPITGFSGTLEGLGHTVSDLHISGVGATGIGLLGSVSAGGVVRNLGLVGGAIAGTSNVGALVGTNAGLVFNGYASGVAVSGIPDVNGTVGTNIGGLVGQNNGGTVSTSYAANTVAGATGGNNVGGLVGMNSGGTIASSYASGTVNGSLGSNVGGLVGVNNQGSGQGNITKSYATGTVLGYSIAGGLVGFNDLATVDSSYTTNAVTVTGSSNTLGGLAGENSGTILNSYANASVTGSFSSEVGGLVGRNTGLITSTSSGTSSKTYATGAVNTVISSSTSDFGGLVGYNYGGTINNAYASGSVTASSAGNVGGLVGGNYKNDSNVGGTIAASFATGTVSGGNSVGGLVGYNTSNIGTSYASGGVIGTGTFSGSVGGLVGSNVSGIITNSYASGQVSGGSYVGGLVGQSSGSIATSYATGQVQGLSLTGGMLGYNNSGTVSSNYFLSDTGINSSLSGIGYDSGLAGPSSVGAAALTTAASQLTASYSGWDVSNSGATTNVWRVYDNHTTPLLRGLLASLALSNTSLAYNGNPQNGATATGVSGAAASGTHASSTAYTTGYWSTQAQGYDISGGSLTITPATLTPTLTNTGVTKVYDGTRLTSMTPTFSFTGLVSGDTSATLSSTADVYDSAHAGTASKVTFFGLSIASITGNHGSLPGDYVLDTNSKEVAATITAKPLNAILNITPVAKTYDGTLAATGSTVSGSTTGAIGSDSLALNTSGLTLSYSDAHVATTGKTISSSGTLAKGALTSSGSGAKDGSNSSNLVVSLPGDYELSTQPTNNSVAGTINARSITINATIGGTLSKVYDGTTSATGASVSGTVNNALAGDTLDPAFVGGVLSYNSKDVATANSISVTTGGTVNLTVRSSSVGSLVSDYSLGFTVVNPVTANITPRAASNWLSPVTGQWSVASNWDVMPSTGNVLAVNIPVGATVSFDSSAASTNLQSLTSLGKLEVTGSNLAIVNALNTANYSQSGGTVSGAGTLTVSNSFTQSGGSIAMGGAVSIRQANGNLSVGNISGSSIALEAASGAISQSGALSTAGLLKAKAASGVILTDTGNTVSAFSASTTGTGDVALTNVGALDVQDITVADGKLVFNNTGALTTTGAIVVHTGGLDATTHSPITINGTVNVDGSINLAALSPDQTSNITLNGPMTSTGGGITVAAYNNFIQNAGLKAALAIDVSTETGSVSFGPSALSVGNPVSYAVNGAPYVPPWIASTLSGGATDFVATFLDKFQAAVDAQVASVDDPLGAKKRAREGLVLEGETCKP